MTSLIGQSAGAALVVASALLLGWRVKAGRDDRALWRWLAVAIAALALGFVAQLALTVLDRTHLTSIDDARSLPLNAATLIACLAIYQGLVRWNRFRTLLSEPADWLNGAGAVLAMAALANLVIGWSGSSLAQWPWWELQGFLLRISTEVVLLGTAATVVSMGGVARDRRSWVIAGAIALIIGCEIWSVSTGVPESFGGLAQAGWALGATAIATCAMTKPTEIKPRPSTTQAETIGAFVVIVVSVGLLVLNDSLHRHGSQLPLWYAGLAFLTASSRVIYIVRSLSQLAQTRLEARSDELTGIANRREFVDRLSELVTNEAMVALLIIDLDHFKDVNDRYGHAVGDALLRRESGRLQNRMPNHAVLARLGGDEFAVLIEGGRIDEATSLATALVDALAAPIEIDGHAMSVGASVGVAALPGPPGASTDDLRSEELLRRADVAMYVAKRAGGGVSSYDVELDVATRQRSVRVDELRELLAPTEPAAASQLVVHYQPQLSLRTGNVVGAEALVRWQHPHLGLLPPAAFLELVELHGMMAQLTARVLDEATTQAVRWHAMGQPIRVSVNLSSSCLTSPELLPMIDELLDSSFDPASLTLEITETSFIDDSELALQTTREIAARGIAISIDDYGTGYSSLSYLNNLPATELKLDRSFTSRLLDNERTAAIVAGTIELGHRLGLRIVAEGVEDQAALNALRNLECDDVQGFHCGRPMAAADFDRWLVAHAHPNDGDTDALAERRPTPEELLASL